GLVGAARLSGLLLEAGALRPLLLAAGPDPPLPGTPAPPPPAGGAEELGPASAFRLHRALDRAWRGALYDAAAHLPAGDPRLLWLARMALVATFGPAADRAAPVLARHVAAAATGRADPPPASSPALLPPPPPAPAAMPDPAATIEAAAPTPGPDAPSLLGTFSSHAGFWLLVAALLRLRVAEAESAFGAALPLHLLHRLAARLGLAPDEPLLLALPAPLPPALPPLPAFRAPAAWRPLAAPRKGAPPAFALQRFPGGWLLEDGRGRLPLAAAVAPDGFAGLIGPHACEEHPPLATPPPADLALRACRLALQRHLRRYAGIGLVGLTRRPGRVLATATHLDVLFDARLIELRLRRAGLDLDPGWVPWLGRVVRYHYDEEGP
ncbi:MAG TPA: hypothetical protein VFG47_00075, partial [Geminicoccaceae bacterium]|nr:hypothetical protein [Geminicoccaceae bacterium]